MPNPDLQIQVIRIIPFGPDEMVLLSGEVVKLPQYDPAAVLAALQKEEAMEDKVGPYKDPRYNSRSSLIRTAKEERLDSLEGIIGDMDDDLYIGLKSLKLHTIDLLKRQISRTVSDAMQEAEEHTRKK